MSTPGAFTANPGAGGDTFSADLVGGERVPYSKIDIGDAGVSSPVSAGNPLPVSGPLTDTELRASAVTVSQSEPVAPLIQSGSLGALNAAVTFADLGGRGNATFQLSGTFTATVTFEATNNGTDWTTIFAMRAGDNVISTAASAADVYRVTCAGFRQVRARCSAYTTGPIVVGAVATEAVSGVFLNFPLPPGTNNIGAVSPAPAVESAYNVAGVIAINTILLSIDCLQKRSVSIQAISIGTTGVVTPEWSNDNATWLPATILTQAGASATTFNAAGLWVTPVLALYFRLRLSTATTAGTTNIRVQGFDSQIDRWLATQPVSGTVTANIGTGALAAGANAIGDVGIQFRANATGAATINHIVSTASTNAASVKGSAGRVVGWNFVNTTASFQYVKLHNNASTPTAGAGVVMTIAIPPNGVNNMPVGGAGIGFSAGIGRTIVTGSADIDATATTLGAVVGDLFFA